MFEHSIDAYEIRMRHQKERRQPKYRIEGYPPGIPIDVTMRFEENGLKIYYAGFTRYSARTLIEVIRWHYHIKKGNREFKVNDHWSPRLSRWFMKEYPETRGLFELRKLTSKQPDDAEEIDDDDQS